MTEAEMVGQHHQLNEDEFEQALGVGDGPGSLTRYSPLGGKESDTTEQLNLIFQYGYFTFTYILSACCVQDL